jgi:hypothetical protein
MRLDISVHAMERSLERIGMTGVELKLFLEKNIKDKQLKHKIPRFIWIKGIKVLIKNNLVITLWKP